MSMISRSNPVYHYKCVFCKEPIKDEKALVLYSFTSTDHKVRFCSKECFRVFKEGTHYYKDYGIKK